MIGKSYIRLDSSEKMVQAKHLRQISLSSSLSSSQSSSTGAPLHPQEAARVAATGRRRILTAVIVLAAILILLSLASRQDVPEEYIPEALKLALHPRKEAVVAILTGTYYIPPILTLGHSLFKHSPHRDRIVLLPSSASFEQSQLDLLTRGGWQLKHVDHIPVIDGPNVKVPSQYRDVMNKLHIWNLTDYDAVGLIDGDAMVIAPIDEPYNILHITDYPLVGVHDLSHPDPKKVKVALEFTSGINAGAMWVKPNRTTFDRLIVASHHTNYYDVRLPEQNLLSKVFSGQWLALDGGYNLMPFFRFDGRTSFYERLRKNARILHFAAERKPWLECTPAKLRRARGGVCHPDYLLWIEAFRDMMALRGIAHEELEALNWDVKGLLAALDAGPLVFHSNTVKENKGGKVRIAAEGQHKVVRAHASVNATQDASAEASNGSAAQD